MRIDSPGSAGPRSAARSTTLGRRFVPSAAARARSSRAAGSRRRPRIAEHLANRTLERQGDLERHATADGIPQRSRSRCRLGRHVQCRRRPRAWTRRCDADPPDKHGLRQRLARPASSVDHLERRRVLVRQQECPRTADFQIGDPILIAGELPPRAQRLPAARSAGVSQICNSFCTPLEIMAAAQPPPGQRATCGICSGATFGPVPRCRHRAAPARLSDSRPRPCCSRTAGAVLGLGKAVEEQERSIVRPVGKSRLAPDSSALPRAGPCRPHTPRAGVLGASFRNARGHQAAVGEAA